MKKLLHERLRNWAKEYPYSQLTAANDLGCSPYEHIDSVFLAIASEIEEYYDPKPRDPEGNPVHKDMEVDGGVVSHWNVSEDGSWTIFDNDYEEIQCGDKNEPIRMPEPKVLDADGVEIKVGENRFSIQHGHEVIVNQVSPDYCICSQLGNGCTLGSSGYKPSDLTHREPDSLEKLREDMQKSYDISGVIVLGRYLDRLTAIMERDA